MRAKLRPFVTDAETAATAPVPYWGVALLALAMASWVATIAAAKLVLTLI